MTFHIESMTTARMLDVVVLSQKNRLPDENPGAKLIVSISLPNEMLSEFDGSLRHVLFTRSDDPKMNPQPDLDGVPAKTDTPNLTRIGSKVGTLRWQDESTGYTLIIDYGTGGKSNLVVSDCKLSGWRITPQEGGTAIVKFNIDAPDIGDAVFNKIAKMKSRDIQIMLTPPDLDQIDIEDDVPAIQGAKSVEDATAAFIARSKAKA